MSVDIPVGLDVGKRLYIAEQLASDGMDSAYVQRIAALALRTGDTMRDHVAEALALVQLIPWRPDAGNGDGTETYQDVDTTIATGGDCEDLVIVLVAVLRLLGEKARVWFYPMPDRSQDHMTAQWFDGREWIWAEPSVAARLGEEPQFAAERTGRSAVLGGR